MSLLEQREDIADAWGGLFGGADGIGCVLTDRLQLLRVHIAYQIVQAVGYHTRQLVSNQIIGAEH